VKRVFKKLIAGAMLLFLTVAGNAWSEDFPARGRTVSIVIPFGPGGASDLIARTLAEKLSEVWGVTTVVENKPGGDFMIAASAVANAKKDGYTIGLMTLGLIQNRTFQPQRIDPFKDFAPIGLVARSPFVLVVNSNSPVKSLKDLQEASKATPDSLTFSSCCTAVLFSVEMLKSNAQLRGLAIPYNGSAPSVNAVLAGETSYTVDTALSVKEFIASGKLRGLAVLSRSRLPFVPNVPSLTEAGVPGTFEMDTWYSLVYPAGVPTEIVNAANAALVKVLQMPDVKTRFENFAVIPEASTPHQLSELMQKDFERYQKLVKDNNLKFGN
jgi:tripartite-type tricarboxylate transporter receptor subunit TctC